jgi:hypothetical protein
VNEFLIALAGGSVGSILTLLGSVPVQVRTHNRLVREADADLEQWVADEFIRTKRERVRRYHELQDRGMAKEVARREAEPAVREEALHLYRDQATKARRRLTELRDAEGWRHELWRRLARCGPLPELGAPARAQSIIDDWAADQDVHDPTRWTLDEALEQARRDAGES